MDWQAAMLAEATQVDHRFDARHRKTMDMQETHKLALKPSLIAEEVTSRMATMSSKL